MFLFTRSLIQLLNLQADMTVICWVFCNKLFYIMSLSSPRWTPRCWPSVRGNSTASSTASASFSSRRSCWWDRTWRALRLELWGPSELPGCQKVPQRRLNSSSSSSSTSHQGTTQWRENPLPHRVTSAPWPGPPSTANCPAEFPWIARRWWEACRASSAAPWTPHCSRACFSSLEGLVSSRKTRSHFLKEQTNNLHLQSRFSYQMFVYNINSPSVPLL